MRGQPTCGADTQGPHPTAHCRARVLPQSVPPGVWLALHQYIAATPTERSGFCFSSSNVSFAPSLVLFLRERGRCGSPPLSLLHLRHSLQGRLRPGSPLLLVPAQTHVLPLWLIPLYGIVGGLFLCPQPLD